LTPEEFQTEINQAAEACETLARLRRDYGTAPEDPVVFRTLCDQKMAVQERVQKVLVP